MFTGLHVFHKKTGSHGGLQLPDGFWHLGTCLRSMVLSINPQAIPSSLEDYEVLREEEAYQFLLEVICGLHSPLLGETEILGQFREFYKRHTESWPSPMKQIGQDLGIDAKKIRTDFLQNLGSHSYGSLIRKKMEEDFHRIHIVGAGKLAQDILPWLSKNPIHIHLYTRSPQKHGELVKEFPDVELLSTDSIHDSTCCALIVAAPVEGSVLQYWLDSKNPQVVFDLRGESQADPVRHPRNYPLHELFADIETNQIKAQNMKREALQAIVQMTQDKQLREKPRPFGWDDLWAL